jgi:hypothetical protein
VTHRNWRISTRGDNQMAATGCRTGLLMEEVFTATVK